VKKRNYRTANSAGVIKGRSSKRPGVKSGFDDQLLGPWCLPRKVFSAIIHLLPRSHWNRMGYFYQDYGCLRCGRKNKPYGANGMCRNCLWWVRYRVTKSLERRVPKPVVIQELPKQKLYKFRRTKARSLLAGLIRKRRPLQKGWRMLKSGSWRAEKISMPFGNVEVLS
jgi:hypothetical protein